MSVLTWFHLTVISILFLVTYYFLSKKLFNKEKDVDPRFYGACLQIATGIVAIPVAIISGFNFEFTLQSCGLVVLMALVYTIAPSLYYTGLKHVDLSETTILDSSGVLWSLFFATIILGEEITLQKLVSITLILMAIMLVSIKHGRRVLTFSKYEVLLLIAPIFYAFGAVTDNQLASFTNPATYMVISFLMAGCLMFLVNTHRLHTAGMKTLKNRRFWHTIGLNAIFVYLTYFCIMYAYELGGEVSRMYPVQQIESVLVPFIAVVILGERQRVLHKVAAAIIAFAGLLIIRM